MSQNILFLIALAIFLVVIIYVGIRSKSQVSDADDYILAGRGVGFWMNVVNVMSIGFAGTAITLCAYFSMHFGLFGGMFGNALTAGLYIVYGCLFGTVIRDSGAQTLPEWVEVRYDRKTRNVIAILGIVGMIGILANNIMSIVTTVASYTGWPSWVILIGSFAVILGFAFVAGMWGVSTSAFAQMIIGIIIIPTFFFMLLARYGSPAELSSHWPSGADWVFTGVVGLKYGWTTITYPGFVAALHGEVVLAVGVGQLLVRRLHLLELLRSRALGVALCGGTIPLGSEGVVVLLLGGGLFLGKVDQLGSGDRLLVQL